MKFTFFLFAASYAFLKEMVAIALPFNVNVVVFDVVVFGAVGSAASPTLTFVSVVVVSW